MALPLPLVETATAGRVLIEEYNRIERCLPDPDGTAPGLIVAMPPTWANKYQLLLYTAAARHRQAVVGIRGPADLEQISWPGPVTLHAHWFASIFDGALNEADAMTRLEQAQAQIETFRARTGARLLWTAHNVFPHGNAYPETFLALRRWIFENFDLLHVMEDDHVALLEEAYGRKAPPTFTVPHMTYAGTVLDSVDPTAARAHFGIAHDAFVFGFFGSLQDYKNLPRLMQDFTTLQQQEARPLALVLGGLPVDVECARELQQRWGNQPGITLMTRKIEDHEIQYLHRAADVMVLPYAETLNSGAAMMAASFHTPFLTPATSAAGLSRVGGIGFDRDAPDGLRLAMQACIASPPPAPDADALAALAPDVISERFFQALNAA
jgi:glycosyltransferase involved in cell wall biosynthesis